MQVIKRLLEIYVLAIQSKNRLCCKNIRLAKKYFTISDSNKFTIETLDAKTKNKKLVNESNISGFINSIDLNKKLYMLATKAELKSEQDKILKL